MRRLTFVLMFSAIFVACLGSAAAADDSVGWVVECGFSHRLSDDPIVFPRAPGASHSHEFFGNVTTNSGTTYESLLSGDTNCELSADAAGYWAPTLYVNGEPKVPFNVDFYYRNMTVPNAAVQPFPPGLRILAGDAKAIGEQDTSIIDWNCDDEGSHSGPRPRDCGSDFVEAHVKFPDCWDGVSVDSLDHKSHMAYHVDDDDGDNVCPPSHPVPVPKLILRFHYPVHDGTKIMLSSGASFTLHADFFNDWVSPRWRPSLSNASTPTSTAASPTMRIRSRCLPRRPVPIPIPIQARARVRVPIPAQRRSSWAIQGSSPTRRVGPRPGGSTCGAWTAGTRASMPRGSQTRPRCSPGVRSRTARTGFPLRPPAPTRQACGRGPTSRGAPSGCGCANGSTGRS
jgi:hypothetical protein